MRTPSRLPFSAIVRLCLALALGACGDSLSLPPDGQPAAIIVKQGDGQWGRVREPLNEPLVVQVTDGRGRPVEGVAVAFELTSAGSEVVPHEKTTDADGLADARLVLGTTVGRQTGQARVVTPEGRPPVQADFSAMALSEDANSMAPVAGQDQTGYVSQPLVDRLVVEVTDGFGNPVPDVPITWSAVGGGTVSEGVVPTGEDGRSRVERTLGPAVGQQTTIASSEGLAGSPVTFVHTALAGNASRLLVVSGNGQTGTIGTALPADLVVRLVDAEGNGVPATAVSWVVATGGGRATPENSTTDGEGHTSAQWTLGDVLGEQRLDAVVSGVGVVSFRATAGAGAPASLFIRTQPSTSARNGVRLDRQPVIQLRDSRGNDVAAAGVQITASLGGGGELQGTTRRSTDAAGRATFDDLSISGAPGSRTLVFTAPGYAQVTSNPIELEAIGTTTRITSDSPDPSVAGSVVTVNFEVTSSAGTPTGSVTVTVTGANPPPPCTVTLSSGTGSCQFTLGVVGERIFTAMYAGGAGFEGSQDTESHVVAPAIPANEAPDADFNWHCEDLTCHFTDASRDDDGNETIANRHWDFGDGTSIDNQLTPSHTYLAPGDYRVTLTVTDNGGLTDGAEDMVNPRSPLPQLLEIDRDPSENAIIDVAFDRQPRIQLRAGGSDVERSGVTVTAAIASGGGALGGTTTATTDGDGRAEFQNLSISGATGPHTLRFTADGFAEVISNTIEVRKAGSEVRITSFQPDVPVVGESVRVGFTVGGIGTPTGNVTVTADAPGETCTGTVTDGFCNIIFTAPGNRDLTATYEGDAHFEGASDREDIQVDPAPQNQPPNAVNDTYATPGAGQALTVPAQGVLSNDTDPENTPLSAQNASDPAQGAVVLNADGSFTYTPDLGAVEDSFTYEAFDGSLTSIATVTITITP